jgi:hypothetical protein
MRIRDGIKLGFGFMIGVLLFKMITPIEIKIKGVPEVSAETKE